MTSTDKPDEVERIACDICLKEVPLSEATIPEAADYFVHFCGIDCYQKWKSQDTKPDEPAPKPLP